MTKLRLPSAARPSRSATCLRLVGLGLVITRDGWIPLLAHAYPRNRPDVTQSPVMIEELGLRHHQLAK